MQSILCQMKYQILSNMKEKKQWEEKAGKGAVGRTGREEEGEEEEVKKLLMF